MGEGEIFKLLCKLSWASRKTAESDLNMERSDIEKGAWTRIMVSNPAASQRGRWIAGLGVPERDGRNRYGQEKPNLKGVGGEV